MGEFEFSTELAKWAVQNRSDNLLEHGLVGNPILARASANQIAAAENFEVSEKLLDALVHLVRSDCSDETRVGAATAIQRSGKLGCIQISHLVETLGTVHYVSLRRL